jgi:hypothetical protein
VGKVQAFSASFFQTSSRMRGETVVSSPAPDSAARALSMRGVCPLKVIEYLLSGVPVIANRGVGDLDALGDAGISLPDFSSASLDTAARSITQFGATNRIAARQLGLSHFSLEAAARGYAEALKV